MKKGFTIIEVALVLAIAGLIFLMVFIALPSLRAQQRDTSRRENMMSFLDNVKKYQTNNRGALPGSSDTTAIDNNSDGITVTYDHVKNLPDSESSNSTWSGFWKNYLGDDFIDPDGTYYKIQVIRCGGKVVGADCGNQPLTSLADASFPNDYKMIVVIQSTCAGEKAVTSANPRKLSVLYKLEGAGIYCNNI